MYSNDILKMSCTELGIPTTALSVNRRRHRKNLISYNIQYHRANIATTYTNDLSQSMANIDVV